MKTVIIDNYDSFTYNLYQYLGELGGCPVVFRNDEITVAKILKMNPTHLVLSPGPGHPANHRDFGVCAEIIKNYHKKIPLLGVCLGHQGIIHYFGGTIVQAPIIMHGKTSLVRHFNNIQLFNQIPEEFEVMRYHSLLGTRECLPKDLEIICETKTDGLIMGVMHKTYPIFGIQFHPESIGTTYGKKILENFLNLK